SVRERGNVTKPISVGRDHRIGAILRDLFHPAMQVPDLAIEIDHGFAIELQKHPQEAVRGWMLRPHVEGHHGAVEQRLLSCGNLYLMHKLGARTTWGPSATAALGPSRPHRRATAALKPRLRGCVPGLTRNIT